MENKTEKRNCWKAKKCGREPGGANAAELGVCPAATETKLNGVHDGRNAGRACWVIAGTFCGGKVQGSFAEKEKSCLACNFYKEVHAQERENFTFSATLLDKLKAA